MAGRVKNLPEDIRDRFYSEDQVVSDEARNEILKTVMLEVAHRVPDTLRHFGIFRPHYLSDIMQQAVLDVLVEMDDAVKSKRPTLFRDLDKVIYRTIVCNMFRDLLNINRNANRVHYLDVDLLVDELVDPNEQTEIKTFPEDLHAALRGDETAWILVNMVATGEPQPVICSRLGLSTREYYRKQHKIKRTASVILGID